MDRKHFIRRLGLWVASLTGAVATIAYLRRFFPPAAGEKRGILLGDPRQYPVDTYTFIAEHNLFIYRDHEGIKAVSAVCTHLGCILERSSDGFRCPCHGSSYSDEGEVLSGPAPVNLSWYRVAATADGKIYVDPGKQAGAGDKYLTT